MAYDGTRYAGFQVQPNAPTVQAELERALSAICDERVRVTGAGRTDAGVHASGQVIDFRTASALDGATIGRGVNALLPEDIAVSGLGPAAEEFHARFSATGRTYEYRIRNAPERDPLAWSNEVRSSSNGAFQLNTWIPDPPPVRDFEHEARVRAFLGQWGPAVPEAAGDATPPDFSAQCEAMLQAGPPVISSVMGLFPPDFVRTLKQRGIAWFATVSTVKEARTAEAAGADVIIAQGSEAGGHRESPPTARRMNRK